MSNLLAKFKKSKKHEGYGLTSHQSRSELVDKVFDDVVEKNFINEAEAFLFADSRCGRFLGDEIKNLKNKSKSQIYQLIESRMLKYLPELILEVRDQKAVDKFNERISNKAVLKNKKLIRETVNSL